MLDLTGAKYFDNSEKLVDILCKKTQNTNKHFFRLLVAYYFTKVASMMRCNIATHDRGSVPVSMYAINLATSGFGKGHSTNIIEESVINRFIEQFMESTFPLIAADNLQTLAIKRAAKKGTDDIDELEKAEKEFEQLGQLQSSFDSGTTAAVKQMRHKLLMANAGSMNMEIDEIGANLLGNVDVLTTFLELFDVGKIKPKLIKNTSDNVRNEEIIGRTPTNMLLFGTHAKLLDGGKVEAEFDTALESGYARRCFFGFITDSSKAKGVSAEEIYDILTDPTVSTDLTDLSKAMGDLADRVNFNKTILLTKEVSVFLIKYKMYCEERAEKYAKHEEVRKAEMSHRYFKVLKLAGTYAFISKSAYITEDILKSAILLAEDSGDAFTKILARERNYVKLANYVSTVGKEVTHVDMVEDLPFYKGSEAQKREMLTLAIAYGYKNNIIIKKSFIDGIEFLKGESLQKTSLDSLILSYSTKLADNYIAQRASFKDLHKLTQSTALHWSNHTFVNNYRTEDNANPGFNMVVIDVDGGVDISTVKLLMQEFTYLLHTTKRHTETENRFRLILPISHELKLDSTDFKEFMENIFNWLPFTVDTATSQRSRKWQTYAGKYYTNEGVLLNALEFIPKTAKCENNKKAMLDTQSLSNLERWFINRTGEGNRSNQLIKYALALVDSGQDIDSVQNNVLALNDKIPNKLNKSEVLSTILVTATKAIAKRNLGE